MSRSFSFFLLVAVALVLSLSIGCGGGSSNHSAPLSQSQLQAITAEMQAGFTSAVNTTTAAPCAGGSGNQYCFDISVNCSGGGTVSISTKLTDNLDANGNGQTTFTGTFVPTNCSVRNANLVLNGDPNLDVSLAGTETGAIAYGPNPQGVCESNLTVTATLQSPQTCTIKGTQCGQQVNFTCPVQ